MAQYLSPGVYVEEVSSGAKPIEGVGTATGAFVGIAEKGPMGVAVEIPNWTRFVKIFGGFIPNGYLAYAVNQFFSEGGTRCFVVRTCHYTDINDATKKTSAPSAVTLNDSAGKGAVRVFALSDGAWGNNISVEVTTGTDFNVIVKYNGVKVETFENLTIDNVESSINNVSCYIKTEKDSWKEGVNDVVGSKIKPKPQTATLTGGDDGITNINATDFEGSESALNGLHAFDLIDDINIVAMPDKAGDSDAIKKGLNYCQNRKDCFFIADTAMSLNVAGVKTLKSDLNSSYGALYYPWVTILDPLTGTNKSIPPSGAVVGAYAYTDSVRGVHKAPAGITDGHLDSVSGVERIVTKSEHDGLNSLGINVIRSFPSAGICIWGARTLSADAEWKYINIRRLFLFIEESIDEGTQWVVFEPNDSSLWGKVQRNITAFLLRVWRDGALFGSTPEEAFFVKVDAENNPPEVRDAGQLIIEVGIAPVKLAEFVVIRISQKTLTK